MLPIPPDILGMIATLYGVGAAGAALLQARQVVRRRSSCEVSARFFATYAGGYAVWLLYGLSIDSIPLILVDAAGLACGLVTLAITLRMRGSLLRPSTWGSCPENPPNAAAADQAIEPLGEPAGAWRSPGVPTQDDLRPARAARPRPGVAAPQRGPATAPPPSRTMPAGAR
jgi:uncharacterized protein with PQ loop repeat